MKLRNAALIVYLLIIGLSVYLLERETQQASEDITVVREQLNVSPAQAFTPRQLCYVIKRGMESHATRIRINGKLIKPSVKCKRLGLKGKSERGLPDTRFPSFPRSAFSETRPGGDAPSPPQGGG